MKIKRAQKEIPSYDAEAIHNEVKALVGKSIKVEVMISSGKSKTEVGTVTEVYPNLFLMERTYKGVNFKYSYTFIDIFTKRVTIKVID
ncbi:MAG: hypothetical protein GX242_02590 [Clostridiales bacterium]|nr:hypothetical protein [Clostridiales bacterium]